MGAILESSSMCARICFAPSAQLIPTLSSGACETEIQKASTVWPDSVRPLRSTMVTEAISGRRLPVFSKYCWAAKSAALPLSVSKMVSTRSKSTPPSTRPRICS